MEKASKLKRGIIKALCALAVLATVVLLYRHWLKGTVKIDFSKYEDVFEQIVNDYEPLIEDNKFFIPFDSKDHTVLQYIGKAWRDDDIDEVNRKLAETEEPIYFSIDIIGQHESGDADTEKSKPMVTALYERDSLITAIQGLGTFGKKYVYLYIYDSDYFVIGRFFNVKSSDNEKVIYDVLDDIAESYSRN